MSLEVFDLCQDIDDSMQVMCFATYYINIGNQPSVVVTTVGAAHVVHIQLDMH